MDFSAWKDGLAALFEQGGYTLWAILFSAFLMWILICERYWFHWRQMPLLKEQLKQEWREHRETLTEVMMFRKIQALTADLLAEAKRNLVPLQALTVILPLLGLLGTVSGMIKVFEVITLFGSGNTRGMASGISEALVTTMAGLFTALSGIYFVSDLEGRAEHTARRFEQDLVEDE